MANNTTQRKRNTDWTYVNINGTGYFPRRTFFRLQQCKQQEGARAC